MPITHFCGIVPPHILQGIASSPENTESHREAASQSLACYKNWLRRHRLQIAGARDVEEVLTARTKSAIAQIWAGGCHVPSQSPLDCHGVPIQGPVYKVRAVFSAENNDDEQKLPGKLLRRECEAPVEDHQANDAYDNCGKVLDFYKTVLG